MSTTTQAVQKADAPADKLDKFTTFMPLGYVDEIKLSINIVKNYLCTPTKTGQLCTDRDAMKFIMLCQAQRLNPFAGDCFLVGYDSQDKGPQFSMMVSHSALLKRGESVKEEYEGMESGIIFKKDKDAEIQEREGDFAAPGEIVLGGWAKVYRKGRKVVYRRLSIAAMMPKFVSQFWQGEKAYSQICKCAEADALRSAFPALCAGLYIEGEQRPVVDITSEIVNDRKPEPTGHTKALNAPATRQKPAAAPQTAKPEPKQAIEAAASSAEPLKPEAGPEKPEKTTLPQNPPGLEPEPEEEPQQAQGTEFRARKQDEHEGLYAVRLALHNSGKTEADLMTLGIEKLKFAKPGQKLEELSEKKWGAILQSWDSLLSQME